MASTEAIRFLDAILAKVDKQVRDILATLPGFSIAVQQGVDVVSNEHRILNFGGAGVQVFDDPANRRTNVVIAGTPATGGTLTTTDIRFTAAVTRILDLWNGSSNDAPPSGWETPGFSDGSWSHPSTVSPTAGVIYSDGGDPRQVLHRHTETLPAGVVTAATLSYDFDSENDVPGIYLNGTLLTGSGLHDATGVAVPLDLLVPGGANTIALNCGNDGAHPSLNPTLGGWVSLQVTQSVAAGSGETIVCVEDQKSSGTGGGTFNSGGWQTRDLNTITADTGAIASLASNQITLPAGTYRCRIIAPAAQVQSHQARLQNITAGTTLKVGTAENTASLLSIVGWSTIVGVFTLATSSALEVQHQALSTRATYGYGVAAGFTTEVYTVAEFTKVA